MRHPCRVRFFSWWRLACLPELPHYPEDDLPLPLWEALRLVGYLARGLVGKALKELRVQGRRLLAAHEVGGLDPEDSRQSRDLSHRRVGDIPEPYPLDLLLGEVS